MVICLPVPGVRCSSMFAYGPADATAIPKPYLLPVLKSMPVLLLGYWLIQVVLEKRPLTGCSSSSTCICTCQVVIYSIF